MSPSALRTLLTEWHSNRRLNSVQLKHVDAPTVDRHARYAVVYEAHFEPRSLEMARVELWITSAGEVSVGFETLERIAQRLGVRTGRKGFAAGHEPERLADEGMLALLDVVAHGSIEIAATVLPLIGVTGTKALVMPETLTQLTTKNYLATRWLHAVEPSAIEGRRGVLRFLPWQ